MDGQDRENYIPRIQGISTSCEFAGYMYSANLRDLRAFSFRFQSTNPLTMSEGYRWNFNFEIATCGESCIDEFARGKIHRVYIMLYMV